MTPSILEHLGPTVTMDEEELGAVYTEDTLLSTRIKQNAKLENSNNFKARQDFFPSSFRGNFFVALALISFLRLRVIVHLSRVRFFFHNEETM